MNNELLKLNETTDDQLVIIREFSAPINLVFDALTKHEHVAKWACPKGMKITFIEGEVKVGGTYRYGMQKESGEGPVMVLFGEYKEIEEPHQLVFTQSVEIGDSNIPETTINVTLEEESGITQMIFHHVGFASKQGRDNANMGWPSAFDKLANLINSMK